MNLGEFIDNFSHNNTIRLLYDIKGGHTLVEKDWDMVSMDWEVNRGLGCFRHYIHNKVIGLTGIYVHEGLSHYPDAINIVIERLENQPYIKLREEWDKSHTENLTK